MTQRLINTLKYIQLLIYYHIVGKFGEEEFGESSMIHQTKPSKLALPINYLLAVLLICLTFFPKYSKRANSPYFPAIQYLIND